MSNIPSCTDLLRALYSARVRVLGLGSQIVTVSQQVGEQVRWLCNLFANRVAGTPTQVGNELATSCQPAS